eukprot:12993-Heterococcus_DN1.PRE.1
MNRWKKRYFVLDNGHLEHYEKQAYVGNNRRKTSMQLQARTVTSYTDTTNCFCVRTDDDVWFLLGNSEELMQQWMTAINAQVHALYLNLQHRDVVRFASSCLCRRCTVHAVTAVPPYSLHLIVLTLLLHTCSIVVPFVAWSLLHYLYTEHTPPADDYWGSDAPTRTFWKMLSDVDPQWIAAYPTPDAPRTVSMAAQVLLSLVELTQQFQLPQTGHARDGLFSGYIIEATQVLHAADGSGAIYLRLANDGGWTCLRHAEYGVVQYVAMHDTAVLLLSVATACLLTRCMHLDSKWTTMCWNSFKGVVTVVRADFGNQCGDIKLQHLQGFVW